MFLWQGVREERSFNPSKAAEQAATLYGAGEAKLGTDEDAFVEILSHIGQRQAFLVFEEYKKVSGRTIEQAIKDEISGELLKGLLALGWNLIEDITHSLTNYNLKMFQFY